MDNLLDNFSPTAVIPGW